MRRSSPASRTDLLNALADGLAERADELIRVVADETQLSAERVESEIGRTTGQLRLLGSHTWDADASETDPQEMANGVTQPELRRGSIPLGPVAVYPASNFPMAFGVLGGDTASALAAGCPVVIKPHPAQPTTSSLLARIVGDVLASAGWPAGIATVLEDSSVSAALSLVADPRIKAAGFTGSHHAGRALFDVAAARVEPIPVYAEMGSVNPVLLTHAATTERVDSIAEELAASIENSAGQFCTKPGVIVVSSEHADRFVSALVGSLTRAPQPMLTPQMATAFVANARRTAAVDAVTVELPTKLDGRCVTPAVFRTTTDQLHHEAVRAENFGPGTIVVEAEQDDWPAVLDTLGGQLTVTIHGQPDDIETLRPLLFDIAEHAGRVIWNGVPTGVRVSPVQQHGGPYPATTASWSTSVGVHSIDRWLRPVAWQSLPDGLLPGAGLASSRS